MRYIYSYIVNIQRLDEETMSERYERLVEAINVIAVVFMRQAPTFKMKLNSQDPRIINDREAITTAHKSLGKNKKCKSNHTLYIYILYTRKREYICSKCIR